MRNAIKELAEVLAARLRGNVQTPNEPSRQSLQRFAVTAVFTLTCFAVPVVTLGAIGGASIKDDVGTAPGIGQQPTVPSVPYKDGAEAGAGAGNVGVGGGVGAGAVEAPATGGTGGPGVGAEPPKGKPEWVTGAAAAEKIRELQEQFKREQRELMQKYSEMLRSSKDAKKEERERFREQLNQFRQELINRQKELRDEIRRRYEEFKHEHPEHQELIDAAKERAKEKIRERRGHGDN